MRKILSAACFAALLAPASAQDVLQRAKAYIATLAGEPMHGRGYVEGGDSLAAEWLAQRFAGIGLQPLNGERFDPFRFPVNTFPYSTLVVVDGDTLRAGIDYIVDPASGTSDGRFHMVRLLPADLLTPERRSMTISAVLGNVVLLDLPHTTNADTVALFNELEQELARFVPVMRPATNGKLTWSVAARGQRNAHIALMPGVVPDTASVVDLRVINRNVPGHRARNVLGVLPAKKPSKDWIVVCAHYDHLGRMGPEVIFPGANDNASGTAMLLTLAEELVRKPLKQNVLFIAFAGEEAGLHGSVHFVGDPLIPLERIRMLVNLDLNGTGEAGIKVVNATAESRFFKHLTSINLKEKYLPAVEARGPACNSDHCPFVAKGVPAVFIYTLGGVAHYHDVHDTAESLSLAGFTGLHRLLLNALSTWK